MYSKLDDKLPRNPKILAGDVNTSWYYICALAHCGEALTDGFIADTVVPILAPHIADPHGTAARCADLGLFHRVPGGYLIPDYTDLNKTRADVLAERQAARERAQRSRDAGRPPTPPTGQAARQATTAADVPGRTLAAVPGDPNDPDIPPDRAPARAPNVRSTCAAQSSPVHLEVVQPESSSTARGEDDPVDNREARIAAAIAAVVDHQLDARNRSPRSRPIGDIVGWRKKATANATTEHGHRIATLVDTHRPDAPATLIAARALGEPATTLTHYRLPDPLDQEPEPA